MTRWLYAPAPTTAHCSAALLAHRLPDTVLCRSLPFPALQSTMLVALLQPAPETFELFDDVMLLASGMVRLEGSGHGRAASRAAPARTKWWTASLSSSLRLRLEPWSGLLLHNPSSQQLNSPSDRAGRPSPATLAGAVPRAARGRDALLPRRPGL